MFSDMKTIPLKFYSKSIEHNINVALPETLEEALQLVEELVILEALTPHLMREAKRSHLGVVRKAKYLRLDLTDPRIAHLLPQLQQYSVRLSRRARASSKVDGRTTSPVPPADDIDESTNS